MSAPVRDRRITPAPMNLALLSSAPHMPLCPGACVIVQQAYDQDGRILHPYLRAMVTPSGTGGVAYLRRCVHRISDQPDVYIDRLDWLDHAGLHIGDPQIVVNDTPGDGSVETTKAFARLLYRAVAVFEEITQGGAR